VIPSKETDHGKSADLNNFDDLGRSSLGDVFSPVRDGKLLILKFQSVIHLHIAWHFDICVLPTTVPTWYFNLFLIMNSMQLYEY